MKIITKRDTILAVRDRWFKTYHRRSFADDPGKLAIYERLKLLDLETCSEQDVIGVIGNDSWTRLICHECDVSVDWLLEAGLRERHG